MTSITILDTARELVKETLTLLELEMEEADQLQQEDQLEITKLMLVPPPAHGRETFTLKEKDHTEKIGWSLPIYFEKAATTNHESIVRLKLRSG